MHDEHSREAGQAGAPSPATLGGRVALVTGSARGVGQVIASALESVGCTVWRLDKSVSSGRGEDERTVQVDVRDRAALEALADRIETRDGGLDILVNNAGTMTTGAFDQTPAQEFQELVDTNLVGIFHCVQVFSPHLRRGGSVVNIASVSSQRGGGAVGNVWYGATKAGVVALTRGLARELGPRGVRVNAISPAVVDTAMTHHALTPELVARTLARLPLGRLAEAGDVADATVFLCSEAARFVTGATLTVDGGFLTT